MQTKLKLASPTILTNLVEILNELLKEAVFRIDQDGLKIVAMEEANVCMVQMVLRKESFLEFECTEPVKFGVKLEELKKILRRGKASDLFQVMTEEGKIVVNFSGEKVQKEFKTCMLEIDEKEQKMPNLSFKAKVKLKSAELQDAIKDIDLSSEAAVFTTEEGKFTLAGTNDLSSTEVAIGEKEISVEGKVEARYSNEFLNKIMSASKVNELVVVSYDKDYPVEFDFSKDGLILKFILAPRVENE